ncbi:MAG TPA: DUF58 domain-containing protein [Chloroflexia bacterium]|nr:DUF58 domain-containing protein [Chloroflexia bacterium]
MAVVTVKVPRVKPVLRSKEEPVPPPAPTAPGNTGPLEAEQADVRPDNMTVSQVSKAWLWGAASMLVIGAAFNSQPLFGLGLVLSAALLVAWAWAQWSLRGLRVERRFSHTRAFWGEEVDMAHVFVNNKPLPVPWLAIDDQYPGRLHIADHGPDYHAQSRSVEFGTVMSLGWYERVVKHYTVQCVARGEHEFGPIELRSGDIFGLFRRSARLDTPQTLLVYPRYVPVWQLGIPARQPFGDYKALQPLATDPLRLRGVREYAVGDNPRHIHWKATAKRAIPQTKLFEPAATPQFFIFCNQDTFARVWEGLDPQTLELTITVAASIANYALEEGFMVGLQVNAFAAESDSQVKLLPSRDPSQLTRILESLARVRGWSGLPMEELIRAQRSMMPRGSTIIVVTGVVTEEMLHLLLALRRAGHPVTLVETAGSERALKWAKLKSPEALRARGITYYLVEAVGKADKIEDLSF